MPLANAPSERFDAVLSQITHLCIFGGLLYSDSHIYEVQNIELTADEDR